MTKQELESLKASSDLAERQYKDAVKVLKVARNDLRDTMKEAARARMRYMRAMGAALEDEDDDQS